MALEFSADGVLGKIVKLNMPHTHKGNPRAMDVGVKALSAAWNEIQNHEEVRTDDDANVALDGMLGRIFALTYNIHGTENGDKLIQFRLEIEKQYREKLAARDTNKQPQAKEKSNWTSATPAGPQEKLAE